MNLACKTLLFCLGITSLCYGSELPEKLAPQNLTDHSFTESITVKQLGKGGYGKVSLVKLDGKLLAMKELSSEFAAGQEISALYTANDRDSVHFPKLYTLNELGLFAEETNIYFFREKSEYYFFQEYIKGKTLKEILQETPDIKERIEILIAVMPQLLDALACLHSCNLAHNDLKLENIMIDESGTVKIIDLGCACTVNRPLAFISGTLGSIAPEMMFERIPSVRTDIYSIGTLFFEFLTGKPLLFYSGLNLEERVQDERGVFRQIKWFKECISFDFLMERVDLDQTTVHFLFWMLNPDPKKRCASIERLRDFTLSILEQEKFHIVTQATKPGKDHTGTSG